MRRGGRQCSTTPGAMHGNCCHCGSRCGARSVCQRTLTRLAFLHRGSGRVRGAQAHPVRRGAVELRELRFQCHAACAGSNLQQLWIATQSERAGPIEKPDIPTGSGNPPSELLLPHTHDGPQPGCGRAIQFSSISASTFAANADAADLAGAVCTTAVPNALKYQTKSASSP